MRRQRPSGPFVSDQSDDDWLWFCLTVRTSGIAGSERLEIDDPYVAWDLDNAVTLRLLRYDNEKDAENKKWWSRFIGGETNDDETVDDTIDDAAFMQRRQNPAVEVW